MLTIFGSISGSPSFKKPGPQKSYNRKFTIKKKKTSDMSVKLFLIIVIVVV